MTPVPKSDDFQQAKMKSACELFIVSEVASKEGQRDVTSDASPDTLRTALAGADRVALVAACSSMERSVVELQNALQEQQRSLLYQARRRRWLESEVRELREALRRKRRFDAATAAGVPAAEAAELAAAAGEEVPLFLKEDPLVAVPAFVEGVLQRYKAPAMQLFVGMKQVHRQLTAELRDLQKHHQLQEARRRQKLREKVLKQHQEGRMQLSRQLKAPEPPQLSSENRGSESMTDKQLRQVDIESPEFLRSGHPRTLSQTQKQGRATEGLISRIQRIFSASDRLQATLASSSSEHPTQQTTSPSLDIKVGSPQELLIESEFDKPEGGRPSTEFSCEASSDADLANALAERTHIGSSEQAAPDAEDPLSFFEDDSRGSERPDGFLPDTAHEVASPVAQDDFSCCVIYASINVFDEIYALNVKATQTSEAAAESWVDQNWKILQQHWRSTAPSATFLERKRAISALSAFLSSEEEKAEQLPVHVSRSWSRILFPNSS